MTKILKSVLILALVAGVGFTAAKSGAWFTDQEVLGTQTFNTGTIDIEAGNVTDTQMNLKDMKPSQVDYVDFVVHNVGSNPANLFKTLTEFAQQEILQSEPKCVEFGGTWDGTRCSVSTAVTDLDDQINYDMKVELYSVDPVANTTAQPVWWENIYFDSDNVTLHELENQRMYLGMVPAGWYMKVMQSYHMPSDVGNKYQGQQLTFGITMDAEQLGASALRLENKQDVSGVSHTLNQDSTYADLTYTVRDRAFNYSLTVNGMVDGAYTLVSYADPWPGADTVALANVTVSGGNGTATDSVDINRNLISRKTWLIPGTFAPGSTVNVAASWNASRTLFETGLMDYYDADIY